MGYINGMLVQSGGSEPHVVFIMETLAKQFPYTIWKIGGKVDRTTRGGGFSYHSVGRACDIYLDAFDPVDLVLGNYLAQMFALHSNTLLVNHIIWNRNVWLTEKELLANEKKNIFQSRKPYTGSGGAHTNHIHVAFNENPTGVLPYKIVTLCKEVHQRYVNSSGDAEERARGTYGTAFNPKSPDKRLTKKQRKKIMLKNMGMDGA